MYLLILPLLAWFVSAKNFINYTQSNCYNRNYDKNCNKEISILFSDEKPYTFPFTKPSCYWRYYSSLIFYEYVHFNTSQKTLTCANIIKERCGLKTNDIITWINKQKETDKICIGVYFKDFSESCYERQCFYAFNLSAVAIPEQIDLPFCSTNYAVFASNFSNNFSVSMLKIARNT